MISSPFNFVYADWICFRDSTKAVINPPDSALVTSWDKTIMRNLRPLISLSKLLKLSLTPFLPQLPKLELVDHLKDKQQALLVKPDNKVILHLFPTITRTPTIVNRIRTIVARIQAMAWVSHS